MLVGGTYLCLARVLDLDSRGFSTSVHIHCIKSNKCFVSLTVIVNLRCLTRHRAHCKESGQIKCMDLV